MNNEASYSSNQNVTRSLTAILFTRATNLALASPAEQATVMSVLQRDFKLMRQLCRQYRGQVLKSIGESLLMTFSSGTNAVTCALKIQEQLVKISHENPHQFALQHSIGMHLGEVFITESDVMGNEVNIAMQLQAEVPSGGLCISQPLYEVVKLSANLLIKPLGERPLKGTSTSLELYQVFPESLTSSGTVEVIPEILLDLDWQEPFQIHSPDTTLQLRERVAQSLERHPAASRMKRLLLFACRNTWESHPQVIQNISFAQILGELQERILIFGSLQATLQLLVSRLNKKDEYLESLQVILQTVKPLYDSFHPELTTLYNQIAQRLEHHPSNERIRKLLIWAIREHWERDLEVLRATQLVELFPELTLRAPNPAQLQTLLHRATQSLNKPAEYQAIADLICQALTPLYDQLQGIDTAGFPANAIPKSTAKATTQQLGDLRSQPHLSVPPVFPLEPQSKNPPTFVVTPFDPPAPMPAPMPASLNTQIGSRSLPEQLSSEQMFTLRYSLMQRANPLRLKALLYSTLNEPISFNDRSWFVLQKYSIDSLLSQLIRQYDTLEELSHALQRVVMAQSPGEEYLQIMETLLRALEVDLLLQT